MCEIHTLGVLLNHFVMLFTKFSTMYARSLKHIQHDKLHLDLCLWNSESESVKIKKTKDQYITGQNHYILFSLSSFVQTCYINITKSKLFIL